MFEDSLSLLDTGTRLQVFYYGAFIALGLFLLLAATYLLGKRRRMTGDTVLVYGVIALPCALVCSRLLFCALDFNFHSVFSLRAVFSFFGGGFSMVGALLGFALGAYITGRLMKVCPLKILDAAMVGILLFMACERLGEPYTELLGRSRPLVSEAFQNSFLAIGDEYDAYLRTYALQAFSCLILAAFLFVFGKKERKSGDVLLMGMLLLGCFETLFYSLRFDAHMRRSFISMQQLLFAIIMALPLLLFARRYARALHSKKPVILSAVILLCAVIIAVVLEFMIDRSGISRVLLYALYILTLCVPAAAGCIFYQRSRV